MKSRTPRILAGVAALLLVAFLFRVPVLTAMGGYLVQAEAPHKADVALVLAGDFRGDRVVGAGKLVREGFVPVAIVSGPAGLYGSYECDVAIPFAVKQGYPEEYFAHLENHAMSTTAEARAAIEELRKRHARDVLIVTSNYHTRRSAANYRGLAPEMRFTMIAVSDPNFTPETWWHSREGQKKFVYEWLKTVATWFGMGG